MLLAHQEQFQSDGAAREKGQSYLIENRRSKCQGSGGMGEREEVFEGSDTELLLGAVEKGDAGMGNKIRRRSGRDSQEV